MKFEASFKKNSVYVSANQVFNLLIPLIIAPYASRVLGPIGLGEVAYAQAIYIYFQLIAGLGSGTYGQRLIAQSSNNESRSLAFLEIWFLKIILGIIGILTFMTLILSSNFNPAIKFLLFVQVIDLSVNLVDISWFYFGIQNFKKVILRQIFIKIFTIFAVFIFVNNESEGYKYLLCFSIPTFLGYLAMWKNIGSHVSFKNIFKIQPIKHLKGSIILFLPFAAIILFASVDRLLIGLISEDMAEVGIYEMSYKFIAIIIGVITALSTVLLSSIADAYSKGSIKLIKDIFNKAFELSIIISFWLFLCLYFIAPFLVPWFLGDQFLNSIQVSQALSVVAFFKTITILIGSGLLIAIGREIKYSISIWLGLFVNIILNFIFIKKYGALGAAYASAISEGFLAALLIYFSKEFFIRKTVISLIFQLTCLVAYASLIYLIFNQYINNLISGIVTLVVAFILYLIFFNMVFKKNLMLLNLIDIISRK